MVVEVKIHGLEQIRTYRRVEKIAAAPGTIHLVNVNNQPICIVPVEKLQYIEIIENDSDIQVV
jgi:hypothetical protein